MLTHGTERGDNATDEYEYAMLRTCVQKVTTSRHTPRATTIGWSTRTGTSLGSKLGEETPPKLDIRYSVWSLGKHGGIHRDFGRWDCIQDEVHAIYRVLLGVSDSKGAKGSGDQEHGQLVTRKFTH